MFDFLSFSDRLGPLKIIYVHEPSIALRGWLVVDNVAAGPSIGGLRMAPDVSVEECARLARAMTLKNAAAGLPHGGGKSVLYGDPKMDRDQKEQLIRCFACAVQEVEQYIFGPDMGTNEECMAWVKDEIGRSVGLPAELGGIPLDKVGATGWGLSHAADIAAEFCEMDLKGARMVIQGFGSVGKHAAIYLAAKGALLVGVSDSMGTLHNPDGLDVEELVRIKGQGGSVVDYESAQKKEGDAIIDIECDIWIPAARPDVLTEKNVNRLRTRLVIQGANIPVTYGAETYLYEKGILSVPDFIANAGGVICAAMEYAGAGKKAAFDQIEERLRANTFQVLKEARDKNILARDAAVEMAEQRVEKAMSLKRWALF